MQTSRAFVAALAVSAFGVALLFACHHDDTTAAPAASSAVTERPLPVLVVPEHADHPLPLVIAFHGYGGDAQELVQSFELDALAKKDGFILAAPNGTMDGTERRFFNANDGCCDFEHRGPNDVAYALTLIEDLARKYPVDRTRVYAIGFSNGGAMANRLACDASEKFAAIVDVSGPDDVASCHPTNAVSILHIHGTADAIVPFEGGSLPTKIHPNAHGEVMPALRVATLWSHYDGCLETPQHDALDLVSPLYARTVSSPDAFAGQETHVTRWTGCRNGSEVSLWAIDGAGHTPPPIPDLGDRLWTFLSSHTRE